MHFKMATGIIEEAITGLEVIGLNLKGPDIIMQEVDNLQKEIDEEPKITKSFTLKDHEKDVEKTREEIKEKIKLAEELGVVLTKLAEISDYNITYYAGKLYVFTSYTKAKIEQGARNALGLPLPGQVIGGISYELYENNGQLASPSQFDGIVHTIKKGVDDGIITGTSIPVMVKGSDPYELTKKLYRNLPAIPIKTSLLQGSDKQLENVASWPLVYDSYCPPIDMLTLSPEYFLAMVRSVMLGNDMGITSMPRFPYWGKSPRFILTAAMMEMLGLLDCCVALNPNIKIMVGVMFEVLKWDKKGNSQLLSTWLLNAAWGQLMRELGLDHTLSAGAVTNGVSPKHQKQIYNDTHNFLEFANRLSAVEAWRHAIGHRKKGLNQFSSTKLEKNIEYIKSNGHSKPRYAPNLFLPWEDGVLAKLQEGIENHRVIVPKEFDDNVTGLNNFKSWERRFRKNTR